MRYVLRDGKLVPKHLAPRPPVARSHLPMPHIVTDGMDPTWNPANGQTYDSKAAYYRAVKDAGCEIAGNDSSLTRAPTSFLDEEPQGIEEDIKTAYEQLSARL